MASEMKASGAADFCLRTKALGIEIWIDGGWGVDALLGEQTRPHSDLDIVVQKADLEILLAHLDEQGFQPVARDDTCPWNFVLGNGRGQEIDLHVIVLDSEGNGIYGPAENGELYPVNALGGQGSIGGVPVRCISPEFQMSSHTGYDFGKKDYRDLQALADRFGLDLPQAYKDRFGEV